MSLPSPTANRPSRRPRRLLPAGALLLALGFVAAAATFVARPVRAAADGWQPRRPIELVVPSGAGGSADLVARSLQQAIELNGLAAKPVAVLNKPGGSGSLSLAYLNAHTGNGTYVSLQSLPLVTNRLTGNSPIGLADVTPLAQVMSEQIAFSVPAGSPFKTGQDLVRALRADPHSVSFAVSSSPGGQSHIAAALFLKAAGIDPRQLKIVFFDSGSQALTALLGGHVGVTVTSADVVKGAAQAGTLRILGTPAPPGEAGDLQGVPTWKQQGLDFEFSTWRVLVGPKDMTAAQVAWWDNVLAKATATPQWVSLARRNSWSVDYKNSRAVTQFLSGEDRRLGAIITELGLAQAK